MRSLVYALVLASVFTGILHTAQAQTRTLDSKAMLSIYSQVLAPSKDPGTVMGQDPQMLQGQDPQMLKGQDPQMLQGQDPQMMKIRPIIFYGQDPQM